MTWEAGSPLIADLAELRKLLGPHVFELLESAPAGFEIMDLVTRASDEVRASIKGVDPARIVNTNDYKPAVAEHVHALLVRQGFITAPSGLPAPVDPFEWSGPRLRNVEPRLSSGNRPPHVGGVYPRSRNVNPRYF